MVATGIVVASGGSPFWYVLGCLSVPTLGVVVLAVAYLLVCGAFRVGRDG
jgi:cation transporter-like permease